MNTELIKNLINLLVSALNNPNNLQEQISKFQQYVWDISEEDDVGGNKILEILVDLAYDLDFYEPDLETRKEDLSFYGDEIVKEKIILGLKQLKEVTLYFPLLKEIWENIKLDKYK